MLNPDSQQGIQAFAKAEDALKSIRKAVKHAKEVTTGLDDKVYLENIIDKTHALRAQLAQLNFGRSMEYLRLLQLQLCYFCYRRVVLNKDGLLSQLHDDLLIINDQVWNFIQQHSVPMGPVLDKMHGVSVTARAINRLYIWVQGNLECVPKAWSRDMHEAASMVSSMLVSMAHCLEEDQKGPKLLNEFRTATKLFSGIPHGGVWKAGTPIAVHEELRVIRKFLFRFDHRREHKIEMGQVTSHIDECAAKFKADESRRPKLPSHLAEFTSKTRLDITCASCANRYGGILQTLNACGHSLCAVCMDKVVQDGVESAICPECQTPFAEAETTSEESNDSG